MEHHDLLTHHLFYLKIELILCFFAVLQWQECRVFNRKLPFANLESEEKLKVLLEQAPTVGLNVDIWSSKRSRGYMCVTVHFIDEKWKLRNYVLGCSRFTGSHNYESIF